MNNCPLCQKEVIYPQGVYLKSEKEAHILCIQNKRKEMLKIKKEIAKVYFS
jgi:hypothetical protein